MSRFVTSEEILAGVKNLLDAWCERKLLNPLSILARPYVTFSNTAGGWRELLKGLRTVRSFCRNEATFIELRQVDDLSRAIEDVLQGKP
jgi:hypothetical protein